VKNQLSDALASVGNRFAGGCTWEISTATNIWLGRENETIIFIALNTKII